MFWRIVGSMTTAIATTTATPIALSTLLLAGNATFTFKSRKTGDHFTFKLQTPKGDGAGSIHFLKVLTGSNNETDYQYAGFIKAGKFIHGGRKARIGHDAPSVRAFEWVWNRIDTLPESVEFLPACSCMRCGRKLTHPTSVEFAIGPECREKMGM